jgi:SNF2 family DNA or RNA helicase
VVAAEMPDLLTQDVHLAMYEEEASAYDQIIADANPRSALAVISRLRSFTAWPTEGGFGQVPLNSAKFDRTIHMLEEALGGDEKVVVFSWFRRPAAEILRVVRHGLGAPVFGIDGGTPVASRQLILDEFSAIEGGAVLVLNTRAAGVGLNVQAASRVIHYTLEWNPATEDQATARVYRSGQTKSVVRHRLVYDGSIDEVMIATMERKRELFDMTVPEGDLAEGELSRLLVEIMEKRPVRYSEPTA